jgi:hypothetical protein
MNLAATTGASNPYVAARRLAAQGLAVFPVRGKQPLTAHGVYSATCDASALDAFDWSRADGCGLATGEVSGVDVLDVDVRPQALPRGDRRNSSHDGGGGDVNGLATLAGLGALPETLAALTPSGGRHFYFHHIASSRSKKLADGSVEWFSDKKLVVVPPAQGREWLSSAEVAEAPDWLKAMVLAEDKALTQGGEFFRSTSVNAQWFQQRPSPNLSANSPGDAQRRRAFAAPSEGPLGKSCCEAPASKRRA